MGTRSRFHEFDALPGRPTVPDDPPPYTAVVLLILMAAVLAAVLAIAVTR